PFALHRRLTEQYRRYIRTSFPIRDPELSAAFERRISAGKLLWHGPFLTLARPFAQGARLEELVAHHHVHEAAERILRAGGYQALFAHQVAAHDRLAAGRSTVLATGTGSGKTEAFLLPILDWC